MYPVGCWFVGTVLICELNKLSTGIGVGVESITSFLVLSRWA